MSRGTNQKLKLYRLAQLMLENTDEEHYLTMPEILAGLGKYGVTADRKSILYRSARPGSPRHRGGGGAGGRRVSLSCGEPAL